MGMIQIDRNMALLTGGALALGIGYLWLRGAGGAAQDASRTAVNVAGGVVTGVAKGVGDIVGVPDTNLTECEKAKADGRTWDASFACDAGTFLKYLVSSEDSDQTMTIERQRDGWNTYDKQTLMMQGASGQ